MMGNAWRNLTNATYVEKLDTWREIVYSQGVEEPRYDNVDAPNVQDVAMNNLVQSKITIS